MCGATRIETRDHLLWNCAYAIRFWTELMAHFDICYRGGENIVDVWTKGLEGLSKEHKCRWSAIWAAGVWALWRERNRRVFSEKRMVEQRLVVQIVQEIRLWMASN